jgi:uncharacterized YigZ family protein
MTDCIIPLDEVRAEIDVANSRFIASLAPVSSVEEARAFVARIRKEFSDASHNVPVFIVGCGSTQTAHCSDDGEPGGTAGRPALAVLQGSGLGDVAVVITRYFGGTKLGTGGLVRAYSDAMRAALTLVRRAQRVPVYVALLVLPYNLFEQVRLLVQAAQGEILDQDFAGDVTLTLQFVIDRFEGFQSALSELSNGQLTAEVIESREKLIPCDLL